MQSKEVEQQMLEEIGEDELTQVETRMLQQKYGLIAPQLTASEKRLIQKEERKNASN